MDRFITHPAMGRGTLVIDLETMETVHCVDGERHRNEAEGMAEDLNLMRLIDVMSECGENGGG